MRPLKKKITRKDLGLMFQDKISDFIGKKVDKTSLEYQTLDFEERNKVIQKIISVLLDNLIPFSGKHRFNQWKKGWGENFKAYSKNKDDKSLVPKYYGKYDVVRINGDFVKAISKDFELNMISLLTYFVADKYLKSAKNIFEFGCGPGHNLLKIREVNPTAHIWGLDWVTSSQRSVLEIAKKHKDKKLFAKQFDYFNPDYKLKLPPNSAILTVASLEQTGTNYRKFVDYLIKNKPEICAHIEPIAELLDFKKLPDYLSIRYFEKRKYINGFLNYLRELEKAGKIKILEAKRTNTGSLFVDGHSLIVWKPIVKY